MSRWLPDSLRLTLDPDCLLVEQWAAELTLGGIRQRLLRHQFIATGGPSGGSPWDGALHQLAAVLAELAGQHLAVTVVLANSFVRYAMVPRSPGLTTEQETAVLAHCFQEIYGAAAENWELRRSEAPGMALQPASGVERNLLASLRALFADRRQRLVSIQPRLMAVWNQHRAELERGPAWLLLAEPNNLCLGLIEGGGLSRLRSLRSGAQWAAELPWLLERESCLAELAEAPTDVMLWLRDGVPADLPMNSSLRLQRLAVPVPFGFPVAAEALATVGG